MPTFDSYPTSHLLKILYQGDHSAGKTGSTCALGAAGYNVRMLDIDNGAEIIKDFVTNPQSIYTKPLPGHWTAEQCKGIASRMSYVSVSETLQIVAGRPVPKGDSWERINKQLDNWVDGETKLGNIGTWTERDVLVPDSLSMLAMGALYFQLKMNNRLISGPQQNDWWQAQQLIEKFLQYLTSPAVPCHVVLICHIDYLEKDDGITKGFPRTVGKALSPRVGQYFNHTLMVKSSGQGTMVKRKIHTNTTGMVDLKNPAPLRVKPEYDLETGLADYFRDVRGEATPK